MRYFIFQAMCEAGLDGSFPGLTEEVIVPGKDFAEAERNARVMLGDRYRGAMSVPVTEVLLVRI